MLRLLTLSAVLFGQVTAHTDGSNHDHVDTSPRNAYVAIGDDDCQQDSLHVGVKFRAATDETLISSYKACSCHPQFDVEKDDFLENCISYPNPTLVSAASPAGFNRNGAATGTGISTEYNATTGVLRVFNRGRSYSAGEQGQLTVQGPGVLYTTHLDVEAGTDEVTIASDDLSFTAVSLTGNYSACIRAANLEKVYMDKNLAAGSAQDATGPGERTSDHKTEETQNHQDGSQDTGALDDLCHAVLTGKVLLPAPVDIPAGDNYIGWQTFDNGNAKSDYEGFDLLLQYDDWYSFDFSTGASNICIFSMHGAQGNQAEGYIRLGLSGQDEGDGTCSRSWDVAGEGIAAANYRPPGSDLVGDPKTAVSAYFHDTDYSRLNLNGKMEINAEDGSTEEAYVVYLQKVEPKGKWGYALGQLQQDSVGGSWFDANLLNWANNSPFGARADGGILPFTDTYVHGPKDTIQGGGAPSYNTGGSTETAAPNGLGGGPPGARTFNQHGQVIPNSARGSHPDYQAAEEVVDIASWNCDCAGPCSGIDGAGQSRTLPGGGVLGAPQNRCSVDISYSGLSPSLGSPPSPLYQFKVVSCAAGPAQCNVRDSLTIQVVDIAHYEAKATFFGDLDPKTRVIQGEITIVSPSFAMGLYGYRAYATDDGSAELALEWSDTATRGQAGASGAEGSATVAEDSHSATANPAFNLKLPNRCPPNSADKNWNHACNADPNSNWCAAAKAPCGNDSPYSPKCLGKTCPLINILPGSQGEYYISRFDNGGNAENPQTGDAGNLPQTYTTNTAQRNYSHNEYAEIFLPHSGWLTNILMDVNLEGPKGGDTLDLTTSGGGSTDLVGRDLSTYLDTDTSSLDTATRQSERRSERDSPDYTTIVWTTNNIGTGHGFTLIYQPNYPEMWLQCDSAADSGSSLRGCPMAQGATGLKIVPVYHGEPTLAPHSSPSGDEDYAGLTDDDGVGTTGERTYYADEPNGGTGDTCGNCDCVGCAEEGSGDSLSYVETYDWLVPNVTCTPTTMHCPLPTVWAHINYTTPSLYPEPAEGSCLQQKTGTSNLHGCGDTYGADARSYNDFSTSGDDVAWGASSGTWGYGGNTQDEDNGQAVAAATRSRVHKNWAGNCGDATSYFWFEKIACGSSRTFLTDRSLIEDFVQLTPTWEDIQTILDIYYTTKAPLTGRGDATDDNTANGGDRNVGFTFITADYHIPPVLPPKVNCTCLSAMDAYASLLSVISKTPTPGAPVTLDPEVLNSGTSKIVATLRMYQDPTYSIPASSVAALPIVVTRFYLEVSTKFTRNRITISDCQASNVENLLNDTSSLKPRMNYCDNSTFDTMSERAPAGVTHMDRISMKKFKFQTTRDVFMQCKIRACAQQPCGFCTGVGEQYRQLQDVDLSPAEGEMYAPPMNIKVQRNDPNALTFPDAVPTFQAPTYQPTASIGQQAEAAPPATTKAIQINSNMILSSVSATWAVQNREALTETLRRSMSLTPQEDLFITSISKLGRQLEQARSLQAGGVKVDFVIGVNDEARAAVAQTKVTQLASGSTALAMQFSAVLDQELRKRGQAPVALPATAMAFSPPTKTANAYRPTVQVYQAQGQHQQQSGAWGMGSQQTSTAPADASSGDDRLILGLVLGAFAMGIMGFVMFMHFSKQQVQANEGMYHEESPDMYASKVAALDQNWQTQPEGMDQSTW